MGREVMTRAEDLKEELRQTYAQREEVEKQIALHNEAMPHFEGPLVDAEGFPRADVDVSAVRHLRQRNIMLRNDHKALEGRLAELLEQLHAANVVRAQPEQLSPKNVDHYSAAERPSQQPQAQQPFAVVEEVSDGSPASSAGLEVGDRVVAFAEITSHNSNPVPAVAASLQAHVGQPLNVRLLRFGTPLEICVTPQSWEGQGLLGARLRPA